jgi:hypothetical protein
MPDPVSRRTAVKLLSAAGTSALIPSDAIRQAVGSVNAKTSSSQVDILPKMSTSDVFIPARGSGYDKFSFDFPEPSVGFGGFQFGFMVFTFENAYGLDASRLQAEVDGDVMHVTCDGFVWAGGQQQEGGRLEATLRKTGSAVTWDATVSMDRPIKSVTTVIRGIPRGPVAFGGGTHFGRDNDDEMLIGYPFGAGDLWGGNTAGSMGTPLAIVKAADDRYIAIASRDTRVGAKRFYFQPGPDGYRVEAVAEADGWNQQNKWMVPAWSLATYATPDAAVDAHYDHVASAFHLPAWNARTDVPGWMRNLAMVTTLHGQHYTGYIFNNYARQLDILRWIATQIPADRVMVFLSAWDGRYYWNYPNYQVDARMGGADGFKRLMDGAHQLGFRMLPMFGTNAANRRQPVFKQLQDAAVQKIDGDVLDINWVDWDNDRHQEGWLSYMNLGVASWRKWLAARIAEMITTYGADAYFLDIVGGWMNNTSGDMHAGVRQLVMDLRAKHPDVPCVGEMPYDALLEFIPMYQVGLGRLQQYGRNFQHLSSPAPGRGSSGVHESGFSRFNAETLSLSPTAIPTLQVVDDTFDKYRDVMAAICAKARERAGI